LLDGWVWRVELLFDGGGVLVNGDSGVAAVWRKYRLRKRR
jgi:hypothetical protein